MAIPDQAPAEFVRWVANWETFDDLVNDAKALTWETECEHAVVVLRPRQRAIVRGGRLGIEFLLEEHNRAPETGLPIMDYSLWIIAEGEKRRVDRIEFHTHPLPTGPSDHDLRMLEVLGQRESRIVEIGGEPDGTVFRPKQREAT